MVINYWYLADCKWCLCQGVKCLQFLSSHLPIGSFPPFSFIFKTPTARRDSELLGFKCAVVNKETLEDKKNYRILLSLWRSTCAHPCEWTFFNIFNLQHFENQVWSVFHKLSFVSFSTGCKFHPRVKVNKQRIGTLLQVPHGRNKLYILMFSDVFSASRVECALCLYNVKSCGYSRQCCIW